MLIGKRIKEARLAKGMSQQALGDLLNVSKVSVCGYETGTRTPTLETFLDLIEVLDLEPSYVLGIETSVVSEEGEPYGAKMAKEDFEILNELKNHRTLYNQLCENPKRTVDIIAKKMEK